MKEFIEQATILFFLALFWIAMPAYVIRKIWRRRHPPKHMKIEPVESGLSRSRREPVTEIDAEYGRDYRGPGRKGEPFMAPGGWLVLLSFFATIAFGLLYAHYGRMVLAPIVEPSVDWLKSLVQ